MDRRIGSPFARFRFHRLGFQVIPELLNVVFPNGTRRNVDEFGFGNNGSIPFVNGIQYFDGFVSIHVRVLHHSAMNRSIDNALE